MVVPVFNCEPVIGSVIDSLLEYQNLPLLIVDDGSNPPVNVEENERVHLLRLNENCGKGVALQKAIHWAYEKGFSHILSFDGDGQHRAQDIEKLVSISQENPKAIVIGSRSFDDSVPKVSRFGRKFSNFWVWYQTSKHVSDTQSGLRIYPLENLEKVKFFTRRYDFEIEVLVRGIWRGHDVKEVKVGVIYPPKEERISHFNKLWDNFRITLLNIYLIAYSLVFYQRSLVKVVMAGAIGFFLTLVPNTAFAVLLGILSCVMFRINAVLVFLVFVVLQFL